MDVNVRTSNTVGGINITKVVLSSVHSLYPNLLKLCHFNAQSMCSKKNHKIDEIRNLFLNSDFGLIGISETWLKPYITTKFVNISGYNFFRNDRLKQTGGGVGVYVKKGIKSFLVAKSTERERDVSKRMDQLNSKSKHEYITIGIQFIFLEVVLSNRKLLFGVVYNPNPSNFNTRENLQLVIDEIFPRYDEIVVTGDFNINILRQNQRTTEFLDLVDEYGMSIYSEHPTLFPMDRRNIEPSCIDLLITNHLENIAHFSQIDVPGFSRHDLIFFTYNIPTNISEQQSFTYRDYNNIQLNEIESYLERSMGNFYNILEVDDAARYLQAVLLQMIENFVPLKQIVPRNLPQPWFTSEVQEILNKRNEAYSIYKRNRTPASLTSFKYFRNLAKKKIYDAKQLHINRIFSGNLPTKKFWSRIRNLGLHSKKDSAHIPFNVNEINSSFASNPVVPVLEDNVSGIENSSNTMSNTNVSSNEQSFAFRNTNSDEIFNAICSIKSSAVGNDSIALKFVKLVFPWIHQYLTHMFNKVLTSSTFPSIWKISKIFPLPKTSFPRAVKDLRPISILPAMSKVLEKIIKIQVTSYLTDRSLLVDNQFGFRAKHSTETALLSVYDDITTGVDNKELVALVLLDFSKAFDLVNHSVLVEKLIHYFKFSSSAISLMKSYLIGRSHYVAYDDQISDILPCITGVPQGSILGPLLFSMYINDLPSVLKFSKCVMYADDVQIYFSDKLYNANRVIECVNEDIASISTWASANKLILNAKKSQSMLFCTSNYEYYTSNLPGIRLENIDIPIVSQCKNLGMVIDNKFTWEGHVNLVCSKIYNGLRALWSVASYTNVSTRMQLVKSLLLPHLTYCSAVMGRLDVGVFNKLKKCYNSCLRFIHNIGRFDSVSHMSFSLLGCSLNTYIKSRQCITLHKLLKNNEPVLLYNRLLFGSSSRTNNLRIPRHRTTIKNKSFFVSGLVLYNSLPSNIKNLTLQQFKRKAFDYLCSLE